MKITTAFIIRLVKMPVPERNQFLNDNSNDIDFTVLNDKLKQMATDALMNDEHGLADKFIDIRETIARYEARQKHPGAVSDILLVGNPTPLMAVT